MAFDLLRFLIDSCHFFLFLLFFFFSGRVFLISITKPASEIGIPSALIFFLFFLIYDILWSGCSFSLADGIKSSEMPIRVVFILLTALVVCLE